MEGFGRATIESKLAGTIFIRADTGATTEFIQDRENGYLYKNHVVDSFLDKLHKIIFNQEKALQAAKRGQLGAGEGYSLNYDINQVVQIYRELIGK